MLLICVAVYCENFFELSIYMPGEIKIMYG